MPEQKMIKALTSLLNTMKMTTGLTPDQLKENGYVIKMSRVTRDRVMKEAGFHAINDEGPGGFHAFEFLRIPLIADNNCPLNKMYLMISEPDRQGQP